MRPRLPAEVTAFAARGPDWAAFAERLPRLVEELAGAWELAPDGEPRAGHCSWVLPVRTDRGAPAVLKLAFPDEESEHEALVLQRWGGRASVRLLRADPHRRALLLERLEDRDLTDAWDVEACEVVGGLYAALHTPAPPQLRTLASYVEPWSERLAGLPRDAGVPHRLVEQAVALGRDLLGDDAAAGTTIHTDLHYANVLATSRSDGPEWLAIDPKPVSGDPHYEVAPLLWNRWDEVLASGDVRDAVRRRFHTTIDTAGLDEDRARDWVVVRMLHQALWAVEAGSPDPEWLTRCITIAKAVQG